MTRKQRFCVVWAPKTGKARSAGYFCHEVADQLARQQAATGLCAHVVFYHGDERGLVIATYDGNRRALVPGLTLAGTAA